MESHKTPPAPGIQGGADRHLARSRGALGEREVREIRTDNQPYEAHRGEEQIQGRSTFRPTSAGIILRRDYS
jgi:hypothetical protein